MRKTSIVLGALAAFLASGPPGEAQDGLIARQREVERKLEDLNSGVMELRSELARLRQEMGDLRQGLAPVVLYQCPVNTHNTGGDWVSVGCVGQISSANTCTNYWSNRGGHHASFDCAPVTFYRKP
ncbi:bZIP transcription factor [Neomegalonema sp.]|uniref:bZIP transcription factor n=1 Tax=Neomegalonema sp. TaxID=2039713 RepID=UPI00262E1BC1|nr:bZIP transcription factor [Neomegalonema sp.]MDD2869201.1 bZIP transcription factor [Neomegalonema sp.]